MEVCVHDITIYQPTLIWLFMSSWAADGNMKESHATQVLINMKYSWADSQPKPINNCLAEFAVLKFVLCSVTKCNHKMHKLLSKHTTLWIKYHWDKSCRQHSFLKTFEFFFHCSWLHVVVQYVMVRSWANTKTFTFTLVCTVFPNRKCHESVYTKWEYQVLCSK